MRVPLKIAPVVLLCAAGPALAQQITVPDFRMQVPSQQAVEAQKKLKEAQKKLAEDEFVEAAKQFEAVLAMDPSLMMAYHGLGTARMALKEYPAAVTAFENAKGAFLARADEYRKRAQDNEATRIARIRELEEKLRNTPESSSTGANRLDTLARQEWQAELAGLQSASRSGSGTAGPPPGLLLSLGSAYFRTGRIADAEREYRAAIEANPKLGEARVNLAVVLLMTGKPAEAKEQIAEAKKAGAKVPPGLEKDIDAAIEKAKAS
jgi:tetratricopeptide (TPR) repeat protein